MSSSASEIPGRAGIEYIKYLNETWMPRSLWDGWSTEGRTRAAEILGVDLGSVLSTTNHLESFNGVLKRKHIAQWQRSGQRLRFDVLVFRLILYVLPNIYAQSRLRHSFEAWKEQRFSAVAGVQGVSRQLRYGSQDSRRIHLAIAWYSPDPIRDGFAQDLVRLRRLVFFTSTRPFELWATCATTGADVLVQDYPRYWLSAHPSGHSTCTCADWLSRGGACKHLRALRIAILSLTEGGTIQHPFYFPLSEPDAHDVLERNKHWYGDYYRHSLTEPSTQPFSSPSPPPSFSQPTIPTPLPPPTMPDMSLIPTIEQEAQLEEDLATINDCKTPSAIEQRQPSPTDLEKYDANRDAIDHQHNQRLRQLISNLLPGLHGVSNILQDFTPPSTNPSLSEFADVVSMISSQLSEVMLTPVPLGTCFLFHPLTPAFTYQKNHQYHLTRVTPTCQHRLSTKSDSLSSRHLRRIKRAKSV